MIEIKAEDNMKIMAISNIEHEEIIEKVKSEKPFIEYVDENIGEYDELCDGLLNLFKSPYYACRKLIHGTNTFDLVSDEEIEEAIEKYAPNKEGGLLTTTIFKTVYLDYILKYENQALKDMILNNK